MRREKTRQMRLFALLAVLLTVMRQGCDNSHQQQEASELKGRKQISDSQVHWAEEREETKVDSAAWASVIRQAEIKIEEVESDEAIEMLPNGVFYTTIRVKGKTNLLDGALIYTGLTPEGPEFIRADTYTENDKVKDGRFECEIRLFLLGKSVYDPMTLTSGPFLARAGWAYAGNDEITSIVGKFGGRLEGPSVTEEMGRKIVENKKRFSFSRNYSTYDQQGNFVNPRPTVFEFVVYNRVTDLFNKLPDASDQDVLARAAREFRLTANEVNAIHFKASSYVIKQRSR